MMTDFDPEFYTKYRLDKAGGIWPAEGGSSYIPTVENDDEHDVLIDGVPRRESEPWHVLIDHSGQDRYHGAVMHPSEQWGQWAIDDMAAVLDDDSVRAVLFAVVEVLDEENYESDPVGWAVLYRTI